ncbi:MAG TPA: PSD1 and planctomycete cytochrome C domain-containing protein, partial [Chthoniobacteraceae bacterium]|nr:PSD1 and planctomycete cytochrome C domain-containing protein [Chthoniobacteraceae bacterium]
MRIWSGRRGWISLGFVTHGAALILGAARLQASPEDDHFTQRVWPLLDRACVKCHGPEKQQGELRLDSREAALKGGQTGAALVPGRPEESLMLTLLRHPRGDLERMPPKDRLAEAEIAEIERWVKDGAPWSARPATPESPAAAGERIGDAWHDPRNPIVRIFGGRRLDLWSLHPLKHDAPPEPPPDRKTWVRNPIDRFVAVKLAQAGKQPPPEADRRTLARRLSFDLTGLPPSPEQVAEFVRDPSPGAYERFADALLASPRYGEHQARMWLDVVRYADSNGFDWDEFRPNAWRFRDYVIRSFNEDKPYDRFVREQLAGDEMIAGEPQNEAERDALIATGFLRLGPHDNSAASFGEANKVRQQWMADLVETTGAAFLGVTMACCRCHDHKYDPLSQADHYRLRAFFEPLKAADDLPIDLASEQQEIRAANAPIEEKIKAAREQRDALLSAVKERLKTKKDDEARKAFTPEEKAAYEKADAETQALKKQMKPFTTALLAVDADGAIPTTVILGGGRLDQPKEAVSPGFFSVLDPNPAAIAKPARANSSGRRTALADWIVAPDNPLTARVIVNRIWQQHFGEGLVHSPNDFGLAGAKPGDPALLDWLATSFVREGWSLKKLRRLIVTSATYRQQAPPRRLTAEMLRDAMLSVSGRLLPTDSGAPIWPELPAEVLKANPAFLDDNAEKTKGWYPSPAEKAPVRSVFLVQKRTVRVPLLETFDLPENANSCARRGVSTVAPQALTLLNSPFAIEVARAL